MERESKARFSDRALRIAAWHSWPYNRGMRYRIWIVTGLCVLAALFQKPSTVHAQEANGARSDRPDLALVSRIKLEAFDHSQVMDTLSYLTDVYGPRLTASPEFQQASEWAVQRLKSYGTENAKLEKWGTFGRSWALKQYSIEMLEPRYAVLDRRGDGMVGRHARSRDGRTDLRPLWRSAPDASIRRSSRRIWTATWRYGKEN